VAIFPSISSLLTEFDQPSSESDPLYFFQFPNGFPSFTAPQRGEVERIGRPDSPGKKVSFAEDVRAPSTESERENPQNEGLIGQLEIHKSGAVRMKLANGNIFDVSSRIPGGRVVDMISQGLCRN